MHATATGIPRRTLDAQFPVIRDLLYATAGIKLTDTKKELVRSRLAKRLRTLGGWSLTEYVRYVQQPDGRGELTHMVDLLTTNKTSFFRESTHFDLLGELLRQGRGPKRGWTIWSAGCSSGEEPYTLAIVLAEHGRSDHRILATDISREALAKARHGEYARDQVAPVPDRLRSRYLRPRASGSRYSVSAPLRSLVRFGRLNLMGEWPMRGPFDAIFCRNVMIYFDRPTRERLVLRFESILAPGGYLFVGHSESLTALPHGLEYLRPAVYRRPV